jgi:hypothetical protein
MRSVESASRQRMGLRAWPPPASKLTTTLDIHPVIPDTMCKVAAGKATRYRDGKPPTRKAKTL